MKLSMTVNGDRVEIEAAPWLRLIDVLRDRLHLKGTREGCASGECGACTVLLNGKTVASCLVLAPDAEGATIETVEGIDPTSSFARTFVESGAVQCGFCSAGMLMAAKALADRKKAADRGEILSAIEGNLCRCTGYTKIIDAMEKMSESK